MLYRINLPACTQHLEWVVQLQGDLLRALCDPNLVPTKVTSDWAKARRADIDAVWMERFCGWSKAGTSVLERMRAVAGLANADKQGVIAHYEANIRYPEAFNDGAPPPPTTTPLPAAWTENVTSAYRNFFEMFYVPIFYRDKGYPIDAAGLKGERFTKDDYLAAYRAANPDMKVCPLCDGGMDGAELDHWLAKKHLPEMNCHPQNLLEICGACNGRSNKGEKLALDAGQVHPFANWFHPHLRPAVEQFDIQADGGRPKLVADTHDAQVRLEKLDGLIKLSRRWADEYRNQFDGIQHRIRHHRRRGKVYDQIGLREHLVSWRTDAEAERGIRPHKLLEVFLFSLALVDGSDNFVELLEHAVAEL